METSYGKVTSNMCVNVVNLQTHCQYQEQNISNKILRHEWS